MAQQTNSNVALCPECDGPVQLSGKLQVGQKLTCRRCGSTLVITDRKPLDLILANGNHAINDRPKVNKKRDKDGNASSNKQISDPTESPQRSTKSQVLRAECPECSATLRFHKPLKERHLVVCPQCDETLEIASLHPLELTWANEDPSWQYEEEYDNLQKRSNY